MNVFSLELRGMLKSAFSWTLSVSGAIVLMLAFYPSMQTEAMQALANAKLEGIDPAVLAMLGLAAMPDFTVITNFFGYVLQFITLALMVFATHGAALLLVKEESEGTIEYLYAKPVTRGAILFQKSLAHLAVFVSMLLIFVLVTVAGYLSFSDFTLLESLKEALVLYGAVLFVGCIFSSVGLLFSALLTSSRSASGTAVGIVFGTFVLGAISAMVKELDFFIYLSPLDWIKTQKLMSVGLRPAEWAIGLVFMLGCPLAAWGIYKRKDLLV